MKKSTGRALALMVCVLLAAALFAGCGGASGGNEEEAQQTGDAAAQETQEEAQAEPEEPDAAAGEAEAAQTEGGETIAIEMEDGGVITIELDREAAPITVDNFLGLVREGFYDGLTFHRIIQGFMIQGGDPMGTGAGDADETITGEFSENGWDNPISHERGVISMARSNDLDSASCQFFITDADSTFLDGQYAAFGHVVDGMDVVDRIAAVETDGADYPLEPVVIKSITVV